jgi:hypothetical protein
VETGEGGNGISAGSGGAGPLRNEDIGIPSLWGGGKSGMGGVPASERTATVAPWGLGKGLRVGEGSGMPMYGSGSNVLHELLETSWANGRSSGRFVTPKCSGTAAVGSDSGKV